MKYAVLAVFLMLVVSSTVSAASCVCTLQYNPVCGVDGVTYGNRCQAYCAGVQVAYKGVCYSNATS